MHLTAEESLAPDGSRVNHVAVFCKCELMQLITDALQEEMYIEPNSMVEFYWNTDFTDADDEHFPVAKIRFRAIPLDTGPKN